MKQSFLVAFDGSNWSREALRKAITWARLNDASLTVLSVVEPVTSFAGLVGESRVDWSEGSVQDLTHDIQDQFNEWGQAILAQAEEILESSGVTFHLRMEVGSPRLTICDVAKEEGSELIFIGSRGLGPVKRIFLGSVSDYVIHHAPCSVFVLHLGDSG